MIRFDLILQNLATKAVSVKEGLSGETDERNVYLDVEGLKIEDGEYGYYLVRDEREDTVWTLSKEPLESLATVEGNEFRLRDLGPICGIMKVGTASEVGNENKTIIYRR